MTSSAAIHSWSAIDLVALSDTAPPAPSICGISYPGAVSLHYGEPEAVKSWLNLIVCIQTIRLGRSALWIDFEMSPSTIVGRLRNLGATDAELACFIYMQPTEPIGDPRIRGDVEEIIAVENPAVCVVDAMAGALGLHQLDDRSGTDIEHFYAGVIAPLRSSGAAVHVIDHVTKDRETRGRWPIGSQRKLGAADVGLSIEMVKQFGRGRTGLAKLRVMKDRHGALPRPVLAELELQSDADTGEITWSLRAPQEAAREAGSFRPTNLMEKVSHYLEQQPAPVSRHSVEQNVSGKASGVRTAIDVLILEGYAAETSGPRTSRNVHSLKPFREAGEA